MALRSYKVGDMVNLSAGFHNQVRPGPFEITRLMPPRDNKEDQYPVRGPDGRERAVGHHGIEENIPLPGAKPG